MQHPDPPRTLDEAQAEIERLRTLVEAAKLVNSSIEGDALYDSILTVARRELDVERGTLFFVDERKGEVWARIGLNGDLSEIRLPIGHGLAGAVAKSGESVVIDDAYADPRFDPSADRRSGFRTRSLLCVPIRNRLGRTVGVLQLLNKRQGGFGPADLGFLEALSGHMAIAIENALLHLELVAKNRMERELQLGRDIQARLLPPPPQDVPRTDIAARSVPCYEVGGDYFDFLTLPSGELLFALGDVSGKGVSAALVMSSLQAALRVAGPHERSLSRLLDRLNELLHGMTGGRKYVTLFVGRLDPASGRLDYANAGHNPPLVLGSGPTGELATTGPPIGLLPEVKHGEAEIRLDPGSTLVVYTDGLTDASTEAGEEFGAERLQVAVERHRRGPAVALADGVLGEVAAFEDGAPAADDKTLIVLGRSAA